MGPWARAPRSTLGRPRGARRSVDSPRWVGADVSTWPPPRFRGTYAGEPRGAVSESPTPATDEALLTAAREGDRAALEQLLERQQARIYRFGLRMCRDPEDARDVLQETLLAMARGVREFRGASSLSTWLYVVARSYCAKKRRRSKFAPHGPASVEREAADEVERVPDGARAPDEAVAGRQIEQAVEQAIAALDPAQREVLVLRDVEGLTAPEVAEVLGIGVAAVKSRLHRARLAVRAALAPSLGVAPPAAATSCPDVLTTFSQHLEDEISADVCAQMERHLAGCERCRGACDSLKRTLALCRTAGPTTAVPPAVQASVRVALRGLLGPTSG
ncbi:MAG: sigma-70 family RNA polymerase sigma factor [Deltaproteobacteria bacterium]|nr:sigma-70 family RNA polymerase sigma factor [Deltaproteobacteria bacterium]MBK8240639.1 sigma-70 family RNA polymerase sigma factor [Deltaproteobacteria bacterium]MBP7288503.1 sigma-70 family RNA polymerase sigma factor [Nannocystaceae bacterium]